MVCAMMYCHLSTVVIFTFHIPYGSLYGTSGCNPLLYGPISLLFTISLEYERIEFCILPMDLDISCVERLCESAHGREMHAVTRLLLRSTRTFFYTGG